MSNLIQSLRVHLHMFLWDIYPSGTVLLWAFTASLVPDNDKLPFKVGIPIFTPISSAEKFLYLHI